MNRRSFVICSVGSLATVGLEALGKPKDDGEEARAVARGVQALYDKAITFESKFRQRFRLPAHKKIENRTGRLYFEKPTKMSWVYDDGDRVASDGKIIRIFDKKDRTLYVGPVDRSQYPAALAFLSGEGNLEKTFDLGLLDSKRVRAAGALVLDCTPKNPTPVYQRVLLYVDEKQHHVRRVLMVDAQKAINRFDLVESRVNKRLPKGIFTFTPPRGTRIIRP